MTQDIKDRINHTSGAPSGQTARILPLHVREPQDEGDLFAPPGPENWPENRPESRSEDRPARQAGGKSRMARLTTAETEALVRDLHRLSEICDRNGMDQAAALIEVAARVVETRARLASMEELYAEPSDLGLL